MKQSRKKHSPAFKAKVAWPPSRGMRGSSHPRAAKNEFQAKTPRFRANRATCRKTIATGSP